MNIWLWLVGVVGVATACGPSYKTQSEAEPLFHCRSAPHTGITFINQLTETFNFNILDYNNFYTGGGVGIGDFDQDGLPDIYLTGNMVSSTLYLNRGDLRFEDATTAAGVGTKGWAAGVSVVDINRDGWPDIYVCLSGYPEESRRANRLFVNQGVNQSGVPVFAEQAAAYGLDDTGYTTHAAFFDYDKDGDLDAYLLTSDHEKVSLHTPKPKVVGRTFASTDRLYCNDRGRYHLVSVEAGITHEGYGLGIGVADLNRDGWLDVYVANDFVFEDRMYINNQDGSFTDRSAEYLTYQSHFSMGMDIADYNNDQRLDLMVLDMMPQENERQKMMSLAMTEDLFALAQGRGYQAQFSQNVLQRNNGLRPDGSPSFSDVARLAGVHQTDWSWSALFADFDNDARKDLFVSNGIPKDITNNDYIKFRDTEATRAGSYDEVKRELLEHLDALPHAHHTNYLFRNEGDLRFSDHSVAWGITESTCSNGAAYADLDQDGDLDLVVNHLNQPTEIFENQSQRLSDNHYLRIRLQADSTVDLVGTEVQVTHGDQQQLLSYNPYRGFQSSVEETLHFGLGADTLVTIATVRWTDGHVQTWSNIAADQEVILRHQSSSSGEAPVANNVQTDRPLFQEVTNEASIAFVHQENAFNDFKANPLQPWQYDQSGPCLAVGDVNGDGQDDFFVGGAATYAGTLFLHKAGGTFKQKKLPDAEFEDTDALFFDADQDGDLDLYVVSGGSEYTHPKAHQDRLYRNDGQGNFTRQEEALPTLDASGTCVVAADYDQDGDQDLFVGGGILPDQYPRCSRSYVLENTRGRFTDVTDRVNPQLQRLGIVTAAQWTDLNQDQQPDLVVVGEWMPIRVFVNQAGALLDQTTQWQTTQTHGWWSSLATGDFDADGDTDYVVGNLGLNTNYRASASEPLVRYAGLLNADVKTDAILTQYFPDEKGNRRAFPVASYDALTRQIVELRKKLPFYLNYATATVKDILTEEQLERSAVDSITMLESIYLENQGDHFESHPLPTLAQLGPVQHLLPGYFDGDHHLDLLLVGSNRSTSAIEAWYSAQTGLLLRGNGKGQFEAIPSAASGFWAPRGNSLGLIRTDGASRVVIAQQLDSLLLYTYHHYPPF